jgi:hypothetical protein
LTGTSGGPIWKMTFAIPPYRLVLSVVGPSCAFWPYRPSTRNWIGSRGRPSFAPARAIQPVAAKSPKSPMGIVAPPPTTKPICPAAGVDVPPASSNASVKPGTKRFM